MPHDIRSGPAKPDITSETIEVLHNRVSIRKYSQDPVTEAQVEAILRAAFRAPTSSNIQAYSVIIVRDPAVKKELAALTGNQRHVAECPVYLQFCADLTRMEGAMKRHGHDMENNNLEYGLVASIDVALVGMSAYLAADSLGIKGLMIGAVRNKPLDVGKLLGMPRRVYPVFGMCLGWPAEAPKQKPRMDYETIVHRERYSTEGLAAALDAYDSALAAHYGSIGKKTTPDSWTNDIDEKFAAPRRDKLRQYLKEMGFDFR
ncbi:MAG: NADPH-dependent oxidoreductase [Alphaproteobacteria bacterium]